MHFSTNDPRLLELVDQIPSTDYFITNNGRKIDDFRSLELNSIVHFQLKLSGGKGGFGSLLRAIGSQIHRTTDRQSCR